MQCLYIHAVGDIKKTVSLLENPSEPVTKKRCIMKNSLGDYRKNMEAEKKKVSLGEKQHLQISL